MMKTFKEALAVVLCVVITLTAAPLGGLVGLELPSLFDFEAEAASYSGSCGDNVYWSLDTSTGVLIITGTGSMKDYSYSADVPWSSYRSNIKTVNIGSSVTSISYAAFYYCTSLTSVTIGNSVTSIVDYSFYDCTSLTSITIPDSVTSIGKYAFSGCTALKDVYYSGDISSWLNISFSSTSSNPLCNGAKLYFDGELVTDIVIPDGTESIKNSAFCGCTSLTSVTIPNSVTSIGNTAFDGCTNLASVIIPNSVTSIGNYAFYNCKALAELTMPISAKIYNSSNTFYNCANIDKVTFTKGTGVSSSYAATTSETGTYYQYTPWYVGNSKTIVFEKGITSISANMFKGYSTVRNVCFTGTQAEWNEITIGEENTGITNVDIYYEVVGVATDGDYKYGVKADGTAVIISYSGADVTVAIPVEIDGYKISGLYPGAFALNTSITGFTVDSTNEYLSSEENGILYNKDKTQIIAYPAGKTETSITIPRTIKGFAKSAFSGSTKLTDVYYEGTLVEWCAIKFGNGEANPLSDANNLYIDGNIVILLTVPENVETIGNYAFYSCESLATVTLPDSVKIIGEGAFGNCTAATTVTLGSGIEKIGESAFAGCTGIKDVYYPGTTAQFADIEIASGNTQLTGATIHTEYNSDSKPTASGKCGDNLYWSYYEDGRLVISGKGAMNNYTSSSNAPWYSYRTSIKSVELSSGKISIDDYAFYNCSALENVYYTGDIAGWCAISFGGSYANPMYYASNFYIGGELLTELTIPDGTTSIGSYTFYGFTGLTSVTIPDSVVSVGDNAFGDCTSLEKVYYLGDISGWCAIAFNSSPIKTAGILYIDGKPVEGELVIPDDVTVIGKYTFYNCNKLSNVTIPNSVTEIGYAAFYGCSGINELTIPASAKIYNNSDTFGNCTNIEKVTLTKGTGTMQNYAQHTASTNTYYRYTPWYLSKNKLTEVVIEYGVKNIGYAAFMGCNNISTLTIGSSVTSISDYAFCGCSGVKKLTIPGSAKISNSKNVFSGCTSIESVTINGGAMRGYTYTDSGNTYDELCYLYTPWYYSRNNIKEIIIANGVTVIGVYAFRDCTGLTNITIPDSVKTINKLAFYNCSKLETVTLGKGVTSVNLRAFGKCSKLKNVYFTGEIAEWCKISFEEAEATPMYYADNLYVGGELVAGDFVLPNNVTSISSYAFYGCDNIENLYYAGDVSGWCSIKFESDSANPMNRVDNLYINGALIEDKLVIPDNVTAIGSYAFYNYAGLKELTIPISAEISSDAFSGCTNIKK